MNSLSLLGSALGLGFAAGLNIYATVMVVGLGVRFGFIHLVSELSHLEVLANPYIVAVAGIIYLIEFFAEQVLCSTGSVGRRRAGSKRFIFSNRS